MIVQLGKLTKNHFIAHLKWAKFLICKLYLNKANNIQCKKKNVILKPKV